MSRGYQHKDRMKEVKDIHVKDIIAWETEAASYGEELVILDLNGRMPEKAGFSPDRQIRFESLSFLLSRRGTIDININQTDYHFATPVLMDISEVHVIRDIRLSPDFEGYHLLMSRNFEMETMRGFKPISVSRLIERFRYPVELMQEGESELLTGIVEQLKRYIRTTGHLFRGEMIRLEVRRFFVESLNIILCREKMPGEKPRLSREEIIVQFIFLLTLHCKEEHEVAFYARQLCIDARYLSRILKSFDGRPANDWIDEALMKEARLYLRDEQLTIGQIADILHFSDQSAFGKFFKKHSGMSPLNYRRQQLL